MVNIGITVPEPKKTCTDGKCPFHSGLKVRGRKFVGKVTSAKAARTVTVQWEHRQFLPKFERFARKWSKVKAHNPACIEVGEGDMVRIAETRPLSKTKHFVVIEKIGTT